MKKALIVLMVVIVLVLTLAGTALAAPEPPGRDAAQAAMFAHLWGVYPAGFYVQQALSGDFVAPTTPTPGGVLPPSPVFQP
jgi:hypothetical protein